MGNMGAWGKFNHGGVLTIPDNNNHPVVKFMDTLSMDWVDKGAGLPLSCNYYDDNGCTDLYFYSIVGSPNEGYM